MIIRNEQKGGRLWILLILGLLVPFEAFGQESTGRSAEAAPDTFRASVGQDFQKEQQALNQQMSALEVQGATDVQIEEWRLQNAARFQAQRQRAELLGAVTFFQPVEYITEVVVPDGTTQVMKDFLRARALLYNASAQIHNQLIQEAPDTSIQTGRAMAETEGELFVQENVTALQEQAARCKALAIQQAHQPEEVLPPLVISAKTEPKEAAYLNLRDQLMREEMTLHNQYCSGDLAQMEIKLDQWREQNAARFQQLHGLAQALTSDQE